MKYGKYTAGQIENYRNRKRYQRRVKARMYKQYNRRKK